MGLRTRLIRMLADSKIRDEDRKFQSLCYDYDADGMRLLNTNVSFLDSAFMKAYKVGMHSGHAMGGLDNISADLHWEWRTFINCWAAKHALQLPGDFIECGTNTGVYALSICHYVSLKNSGKTFYTISHEKTPK